MATGVTAQGSTPFWGSGSGNSYGAPTPSYGTVPYRNVDPAKEPPAPTGLNGMSPDEQWAFVQRLMTIQGMGGSNGSNALNYDIYTPQETAQRGLAMNASTRGALDAQGNFIGVESANNTLKNQLAGQDIGQQARMAALKAAQDRHSAQGAFAANGAISSEASRQALGSTPNAWKDTQPWMAPSGVPGMGGSVGDIQQGLNDTNAGLYRQLQGQQSDYNTAQAGLYNQLQQLSPQYLQSDQVNETFNRLLNGQYNTNVSPEQAALMSALQQSLYRTKVL